MKQYTISFIGAGNIGGALIQATEKVDKGYLIKAFDVSEKASLKAQQYGAIICQSITEVVAHADIVIMAIKPQYYNEVMEELAASLPKQAIIISLAPGYGIATLKNKLGQEQRIVRAMPNTPAQVGEGMSAVAFSADPFDEDEKNAVLDIFRGAGHVIEVREEMMDSVMALSGCAPAYGYIFIESLGDIGTALGLPRAMAYELAAQTLLGASKMVLESGKHPGELKDMVCTPGGTTIQGVMALEESGFRNAIIQAVAATYRKAKEL